MRNSTRLLLSLCLSLGLATTGQAAGQEFSANMHQQFAPGKSVSGKIYVSADRMRTDMSQEGRERITIVDVNEGTAWMLNPARKEYVEMRSGGHGGGMKRPALPGEPGSPCTTGKGLTCNKLGTESINGRQAEKWEFVMEQGGNASRSTVWIDRGLNMPIREESGQGMVRELRDIQVGPQDKGLFAIPSDYKKIALPSGGRGPQGGHPPQR